MPDTILTESRAIASERWTVIDELRGGVRAVEILRTADGLALAHIFGGLNVRDDALARAHMMAAAPRLAVALQHALPYAEQAVKFFRFQRDGHEFWPNREEAEANIAEMRAALRLTGL